MRRVIVHVGLSKAGSTSLQAALAASREALAAEGAAYPAIGGRGVKEQKPVWAALAGDRSAAEAVRRAVDAVHGETLVLSGETLFKFRPRDLSALLERTPFAGADITGLALVRDPAAWLNSRYAYQATGLRITGRFDAFVRAELPRADVRALLLRWAGRLVVLPLSDRRDARPAVERAFAAMGFASQPAAGPTWKPAPDPRTVEVGRRVAAGFDVGELRQEVRRGLLVAATANSWTKRFNGLDAATARAIAARTAAWRDRFAREVWKAPWDEVCGAQDPEELVRNEWRSGDAAGEDAIAQVVAELSGRLPARSRGVLGWLRRR